MKHLFTLLLLGGMWIGTAYGQYCIPTYSTGPTVGDSIVSFQLGTILGVFPTTPSGYNDYTPFTNTELVHNNTYTATIVNNPSFGSGVALWIDYNVDSIFQPAELLGTVFLASGETGNITFTVPGTATLGKTRLRMLQNYNSIITDPCASTTFGETEDYSVNMNMQLNGDVGPTSFVLDDLDCGIFNAGAPVTVDFGNFGLTDADTIPVAYTINGGTPVIDTLFNLLSGQNTNFTFSTLATGLIPSSIYTIQTWTAWSGDLNPTNDTLTVTIQTPIVEQLPYSEDFETFTSGSPGTLTNGWTRSGGTNFNGWLPEDDGVQNTTLTGPLDDHTPGGSVYMYTEAATNGVYSLTSPCISLSGLTSPRLSFWYHMFGTTMGTLEVHVLYNGIDSTIWTLTGQQQTAEGDDWIEALVDLTGFAGETVNIEFRSLAPGFSSDMAIDDIQIYQPVPVDVGALEVLYPDGAGCYGSAEEIVVRVRNYGNAPLDFSVNNMTVGVDVSGAVTANYSTTVTTGVLGILDSLSVTVTTAADLSVVGLYDYLVYTSMVADTVLGNDSTTDVSETLPIFTGNFFEDFETFSSGTPGVLANGWTRDNFSTAFGWWPENDGVTNSGGTGPLDDHTPGGNVYMYTETSSGALGNTMALYSPCIDLTAAVGPRLSFFYHMFGINMGTLEVWVHSGTLDTMVWSLSGPQQTAETDEWLEAFVDMDPFVGTSLQVEFRGIRGNGFESDMSIDDVSIYTPAPIDGAAVAVEPTGASCYTATESVTVLVRNLGSTVLDFSANNLTVNLGVSGASTQTFSTTVNTGTLGILDTLPVVVTTTADFTALGFHNFDVDILLVGDTTQANDSTIGFVEALPIVTAPFFEDFETFTSGSPGTLANGWTRENFTTGFGWWPENDGVTNSGGTGPLDDHTPGGNVYMYTETSGGAIGNVMSLFTPCIDMTGLSAPRLSFWYHMFGNNMGDLEVYANAGGVSTLVWSISGQQQTAETDEWLEGIGDLTPFVGSAIQLEFRGIRGDGFGSDMAIDDVLVYDPPPLDAGAVAISPEGQDCFLAPDSAFVQIINLGNQPLDLAVNNVTVTLDIAGPAPQSYSATATSGVLPVFGTLDVLVTPTANFTIDGFYTMTAYTSMVGDTLPQNDTTTADLQSIVIFNGGLQEDFETFIAGTPGTYDNGWTFVGGTTNSGWFVEEDGVQNNTQTGPLDDHTPGGNIYMYMESSGGLAGDEFSLFSPCVNLAQQTTPSLTFWYHMFGISTGTMEVHILYNNQDSLVWSLTGQQQTAEADPWRDTTLDLSFFATQLIQIEFRGIRGTSFTGDMAIDDINLFELLPQDGGIETVFAPQSACALTDSEDVVVAIFNYGSDTIFSTDVFLEIDGGTPITLPFNDTIAPGGFVPFFFPGIDFSVPADYDLKTWTGVTGDTNFFNDTTEVTVTSIPLVSSFPYFEDFESGTGGWLPFGTNQTWEFGTPNKVVIQGASSGVNAWVAGGLTGLYNNGENGFILGPCFDFTTILNPIIELDIWWENEFSWDGAVLQSSIDNGLTWVNVGAVGDPDNWYTDNTIGGNPGGQQEGWSGRNGTGSNGWVLAKHDLDNLGGQSDVQLRIAFGTDASGVDDGFAFDNIFIYEKSNENFGVTSIISPSNSVCTGDSVTVEVLITNEGAAAQTNVPITMQITGAGGDTLSFTYVPSLAPDSSASVVLGTFVATTPGVYDLTAFTILNGDTLNFNDTTFGDFEVFITPDDPIVFGDSICSIDSAQFTLIAGSNAGDMFWYDSLAGGSVVHVGDTFVTPFLSSSSTYYVEASSSLSVSGFTPADNTIGAGTGYTFFTDGLVFDVFQDISLNSVRMYPQGPGTIVVNLLDPGGTTIQTSTFTYAGPGAGDTVLTLGWEIAPGIGYSINAGGSNVTGGFFRNTSGAAYPYEVPGIVSVTNAINNLAGFYYFFYDWDVNIPGCSSARIPVEAIFAPPVAVDLGSDGTVCAGYELDAFSPEIVSYLWNNDPTITTPSINADTSGIYTVLVENAEGCTGADTVVLLVNPTPLVMLGPDTTQCDEYLMSGGNPGATYFWTGPNPNGNPVNEMDFPAQASGLYTVTVTALGCSSVDTIDVTINESPAVALGDDRGICTPAMLDGGSDGVSFLWSTGETSQMITVPVPTGGATETISVTVTGANGCVTDESVTFSEGTPPVFELGADTSACDELQLTAEDIPGATYAWSTGETTNSISATMSGLISLTITDSAGCEATDEIMVDVQPTPVAAASFENNNFNFTVNFLNQSNPATGADYKWDFGDGGTSTEASPIYTYGLPGAWQVTLIVSNDCGADTTTFVVGQVSIEDDLFGSMIQVYPNPTKGEFFVSSQDMQAEALTIEVLDTRGRSVITHVENQVFGAFVHSINLIDQAEGVYVIKISDGERTAYKRIVRE